MTASNWTQAYGWGPYDAYAMRSGTTVRMGLTWAGDPGPVFLTVSAGIIPSTLIREHPTRDLTAHTGYAYVTTEWITVTATSSTYGWVEGIGLGYLGTYQSQDDHIIEAHHDLIQPPRFHVIAERGRAVAWVQNVPVVPGHPHPRPVIAPVGDDHTLHLDVEIEDAPDSDARAELLSKAISDQG
jgi:hypothetical protein